MVQLSASLNHRKAGSLPSDTVQNSKNDGHCMAVITRTCKVLSDPVLASDASTEKDDGKASDPMRCIMRMRPKS